MSDARKPRGPLFQAFRRLARTRRGQVGGAVVLLMVLVAFLAPWVAPYHYNDAWRDRSDTPSSSHPFGLDGLNRDVLSRAIYGARVSLRVAVAATAVSVLIGILAGATAGYLGRWADEGIMRLADAFSAFPGILLAVAITAAFRTPERTPSMTVVFLALGVVGWPSLARIVRSRVLTLREEDYILAARAQGASSARIIVRHLLPNCLAPVIVAASVLMAGNILGEAGLSFLGIGVQLPHPSWGNMLGELRGDARFQTAWWMSVYPGGAIALAVLGFNLLGDALRDALDPRMGAGRGE